MPWYCNAYGSYGSWCKMVQFTKLSWRSVRSLTVWLLVDINQGIQIQDIGQVSGLSEEADPTFWALSVVFVGL